MDVELKPGIPGCLGWTLNLMTLGLFGFLLRRIERSFPKRLEEDALLTRGGKRIPWTAFTRVTQVRYGSAISNVVIEYLLDSPQGRVSFHQRRLKNLPVVMAFLWSHLPEQVQQGRS